MVVGSKALMEANISARSEKSYLGNIMEEMWKVSLMIRRHSAINSLANLFNT